MVFLLLRAFGGFVRRFLLFSIILLAGSLGVSSTAFAAKERLIAVIMVSSQQRTQDIHAVFIENSQAFCGDDCRIYVQTPNADVMSLRNSVRKAVALGAELIITYGTSASLAAKAEASPVPTLFVDVYEPVRLGIVSARSQTGRNMTGVRGDAPIQALFKYFTEATQARKLAVLYDIGSQEGALQKKLLEETGKKKGIIVIPLPIENPKEHVTALKTLPEDVEGLFMACSDSIESHLPPVLEFAAKRQLPVMTQHEGAAEMGAFMVLETSSVEQGEKLAQFAGQILSGEKTDDLPMYLPHQVAFVVNLKVAKQYGLQIPFQTLSVTSRVIR